MKKKIAVITLLILTIAAIPFFAFAASSENDGSDVHAPSMSVGSGEEPIVDESTTVAPDSSNSDSNNGSDNTADVADSSVTDSEDAAAEDPGVIAIAAGGCLLIIVIYRQYRK